MLAEAEANNKSAADMMREALAEEERQAAAGGAAPEPDDAGDAEPEETEERAERASGEGARPAGRGRPRAPPDGRAPGRRPIRRRERRQHRRELESSEAVPALPSAPVSDAAPDELAQAVAALSVQLARVGSNLNQATKSLNAGALRKLLRCRGDDETAGALRETRAVLEQILPVLARAMEVQR